MAGVQRLSIIGKMKPPLACRLGHSDAVRIVNATGRLRNDEIGIAARTGGAAVIRERDNRIFTKRQTTGRREPLASDKIRDRHSPR